MVNSWSEHLSPDSLGSFRAVCVSSASLRSVSDNLEVQGFRAYAIDSTGVDNKTSLLAALADCFGLMDHFTKGSSSWDAASDLIWQALIERREKRVALLWEHADAMIASETQLFLDALEMLYALGDTLERHEASADYYPVLLRIVLFGEGRSFPRWQS